MNKYYIGVLEIRSGEYEYNQTYKFSTSDDPYRYLNGVASRFYGEPDVQQDKDATYHYFNRGEVAVDAGGIQKINEAIFNFLTLIPEL